MKKLMVLALLIVGTTIVAQERNRKHHGNDMEQFTPEQQTQLMVKKLTLELDLTEAQQKDISVFMAENRGKKEAHKTAMKAKKEKGIPPTNEERFTMANKMLDEKIANKKRMEKILNPKQMEKWAEMKKQHHEMQSGKHKQQRHRQG